MKPVDRRNYIKELLEAGFLSKDNCMKILNGEPMDKRIEYLVDDRIIVTDRTHYNHNKIGRITRYDHEDNSYMIEFVEDTAYGEHTTNVWFFGIEQFQHAKAELKDPSRCRHTWKEELWFTSKIIKTCTKCQMRYEDYDDGLPF